MKHWFVYYRDDYAEMGGVGMGCFDSLDFALEFIQSRLSARGSEGDLNHYNLIEGKNLPLVAVSTITKVAVAENHP